MAGVSTPTVSRFENGEKDIQLSTVLSILTVLGMTDQRNLIFINEDERYDPIRMVVSFTGKDGKKTIKCAISNEALEDHFKGGENNILKTYQANREKIQHEIRRKYLAEQCEPDGSILLKSEDISY